MILPFMLGLKKFFIKMLENIYDYVPTEILSKIELLEGYYIVDNLGIFAWSLICFSIGGFFIFLFRRGRKS